MLFNFNQDSAQLNIKISNAVVHKKDDLLIRLEVTNLTTKPMLIHRYNKFDYMPDHFRNDFNFIVEGKTKSSYAELERLAYLHPSTGYDSLGVSWDDIYDTLAVGKTHTAEFNIIGYYPLPQGKYRTRFRFNAPGKNNTQLKMVYSNWVYFEVRSDEVEYDRL